MSSQIVVLPASTLEAIITHSIFTLQIAFCCRHMHPRIACERINRFHVDNFNKGQHAMAEAIDKGRCAFAGAPISARSCRPTHRDQRDRFARRRSHSAHRQSHSRSISCGRQRSR